ncbi:hypothetical protein LTS18_000670, partial [Coniosporium uncinatum]
MSRYDQDLDGSFSDHVDISDYDTQGFCGGYELRRHKNEYEANAGCHEARQDWIYYIGPIDLFGNYNPINGNFTAVELDGGSDSLVLEENGTQSGQAPTGAKQMQAKMLLELSSVDARCAERVKDVWKTMVSTTFREKSKSGSFGSIQEYIDFRIIDTGAPFVEAMMLWGMGMILTPDEDKQLAEIVKPCYAALGLANDYFSFDREWSELTDSGGDKLTNAVWLLMQWHRIDVAEAKQAVRGETNKHEQRFQELRKEFVRTQKPEKKLIKYLEALSHQVSGNVLQKLHIGQGQDLFWTRSAECPTEDEYITMVDRKTGGLFQLVARLMQVNAPKAWSFELDNLTVLIGRYFQVRDDYSNLSSPDYAVQKGFCEDLDEGKFSFPIVHALNIHDVPVIPELVSFVEKKIAGCGHLSKEQKVLVLEALDKSGSF